MMDERGFFDALLLAWLCLSLAVFLILSIVRALFAELRRRARQHWEMRAPQCARSASSSASAQR